MTRVRLAYSCKMKFKLQFALTSSLAIAALSACGSAPGAVPGKLLGGAGSDSGFIGSMPFSDDYAGVSSDPNHITLALKFVEFTSSSGKSALSPDQIRNVVHGINSLYSVCNMHVR